jgi:hypothetical protein
VQLRARVDNPDMRMLLGCAPPECRSVASLPNSAPNERR